MGEQTKIQWCDHTFNPWVGCTMVSEGCVHCYAENSTYVRVLRSQGKETWGNGAPRQRTSEDYWKHPLAWNRKAAQRQQEFENRWGGTMREAFRPETIPAAPQRPRVFCASTADWLDDEVPIEWLADLLKLIHDTPYLDWLLLTKRPENWRERIHKALAWMMAHIHVGSGDSHIIKSVPRYECAQEVLSKTPEECKRFVAEWIDTIEMVAGWVCSDFEDREDTTPANVWIGTTVENQKRADERIPLLLQIPAKVRFLSVEPMLEEIRFPGGPCACGKPLCGGNKPVVDWIIFGGESGLGARPCNVEWIRSGVQQCKAAGIPVFVKQLGAFPVMDETAWRSPGWTRLLNARLDRKAPEGCVAIKQNDPKGGDINEWPEDLRIREFPEVAR